MLCCIFLNTAMIARPPFNALHVFCVVVREGGFRPAARALHLTAGAVSRQVAALEAHLKLTLFDRSAGSPTTLTPAGRRLHERVADRIDGIAELLEEEAHPGRQTKLLVDTSVTLAMYWLIPQLRSFSERHPGIHVQVRTADGDIDPTAPVDVFIRRELSELRSLPAKFLVMERSVLVASPAVVPHGSDRIPDPKMTWLLRAPRIGMRSRPDLWPSWGDKHEMGGAALEPTMVFDNTVLAIQAALQGLGVLVVPELFVGEMLSSGSLRKLHGASLDTGSYSFAVGRQRESMRVTLFTDWLATRVADQTGPARNPTFCDRNSE